MTLEVLEVGRGLLPASLQGKWELLAAGRATLLVESYIGGQDINTWNMAQLLRIYPSPSSRVKYSYTCVA